MVWLPSQRWFSLLCDVIWWQCTNNTLHVSLLLVGNTLAISVLCFRYLHGSLLLENQKISQTDFLCLFISLSCKSRTSNSHWRAEEWRHSDVYTTVGGLRRNWADIYRNPAWKPNQMTTSETNWAKLNKGFLQHSAWCYLCLEIAYLFPRSSCHII